MAPGKPDPKQPLKLRDEAYFVVGAPTGLAPPLIKDQFWNMLA